MGRLLKGNKKNSTVRSLSKKLLIYVLAPFVFIALIEGLMRWGGYGNSDEPFLISPSNHNKYVSNENFGRLYFPFSGAVPIVSEISMEREKPVNGIRVFVVGENSASGYQWAPNGKISQFLHQILKESFSENDVEVLDLSVPGINFHAMLDIMTRLTDYKPDAIVIYIGHNEFYGSLSPASVDYLGQNRNNIGMYLHLHQFRLFQLMKNLYVKYLREGESIEIKTDALIGSIAERIEIKPESEMYKAVFKNYSYNLNEMLEFADSEEMLLLGVIPTSNFADKAPFRVCSEEIINRDKWLAELEKGRAFLQAEKYEEALSYFLEAGARFGTDADLEYLIATAYQRSGNIESAREYYRKAVDSDCFPFRSPTEFNHEMAKLFSGQGQPVVSVGLLMDSTSANGVRGDEFFLDAVHFSLRGAAVIAERIGSELIYQFGGERRPSPESTDIDMLIERAGISSIDYALAELRVTSIRSHWPYTKNERTVPAFSGFRDDHAEELAYKVVNEGFSWRDAHRLYADSLYDLGLIDEAARDYRALVVDKSDDVVPYHRLAENLIRKGLLEEAYELLDQSLQIEETVFALKWIGSILLGSDIPEEALEELIQAHFMEPADMETLYNLTSALIETKRVEDAKESLRTMIAAAPKYPGIFDLAERIRQLHE